MIELTLAEAKMAMECVRLIRDQASDGLIETYVALELGGRESVVDLVQRLTDEIVRAERLEKALESVAEGE